VARAVAAIALGCATTPPAPPPPAAFYWVAEGPHGSLFFLLGSVHIGDGRELELPPQIALDWMRADELVVEVDTRGLSAYDALESAQRYGLLPPQVSLWDVVSGETWAELVAYLRAHHYPVAAAGRMRPWLIAQLIAQMEFEAAGYDARNGVDAWFLGRADGTRTVQPLESLDEQMSVFAALPAELQEELLREILEKTDAFVETTHAMLRAFETGDEAMLLEVIGTGPTRDPARRLFHERFFVERNRRMAERLALLSTDPSRTRFVVVGTGHLIGPDSVPALLEDQGFEVERVPDAYLRVVPPEPPIPEHLPVPSDAHPAPHALPAPAPAPPAGIEQAP
jgi:uncharacterized protein YbaP (TraB family)